VDRAVISRRAGRWAGLVLLVVAAPWALYALLRRLADLGPRLDANRFLLPALSVALVLLTLGLAGVLIRDLVKLIIERKRGILGSTLRMKLVFFYLALVLVPALVLFSGSAQVIIGTVEALLGTSRERMAGGQAGAEGWSQYFEQEAARRAGVLAAELGRDSDPRGVAERTLAGRAREAGLDCAGLVAGGRLLAGAPGAGASCAAEFAALDDLARQARSRGGAASRLAPLGDRLVALAAVPLARDGALQVVVAAGVPEQIAAAMRAMATAEQDYRRARLQRRELVRFYLTLIGLIFIATLFVATWIGMYISRRITGPIQDLAAAAREISAGNLAVRVHARSGDELGMLIEAFNEMAAELQESREVITRSTADLRRSNQALDERRRYVETLVANLSTAVISLDSAGGVTTANPAVQQVLGVALAPGDDAVAVLRRERLGPLADLVAQALASGQERTRRDCELPAGSAPTLHVGVRLSALRGREERERGTLVMIEDLSDVLRAQRAAAWQEVARRIAHEIKNPLTPIQLAAERLRRKYFAGAADLEQVIVEATAAIEHEVGALKRLVDEFSRFARMPEVEPHPVDLRDVVESLLKLYQGLPRIRWDVRIEPELTQVHLDAEQMRRALINLIDNAVSALGGEGEIRIAAQALRTGGVRIEVADSGPGIAPADREHVFAPYYSTKSRGTGLGLAIVHRVVTDHRGTVRVEDNVPRGARFVIEIPAQG